MNSIKRKYKKRNLNQEAKNQAKLLLQQKAREDFLLKFSNSDYTDPFNTELLNFNEISDESVTSTFHQPKDNDTPNEHLHINPMAKQILEKWMYDHRFYCYPNKAEKIHLAKQTNLSLQKVSNWFINSRRRMLPKLLEFEGKRPLDFMINRKSKQNEKQHKTSNQFENHPAESNSASTSTSIATTTFDVCEEFRQNFSIATQENCIDVEKLLNFNVKKEKETNEKVEIKVIPMISINQVPLNEAEVYKGLIWDRSLNQKYSYLAVKH